METSVLRIAGAAVVAALGFVASSLDAEYRILFGIIAGIPSLALMFLSRRQLGASFSVRPEARALVTTGLYARIRHPMYVFLDILLLSIIVVSGWKLLLVIWGALVVVQIIQASREEKVLAARFGDVYAAYTRRTWF